MSEFLIYILTLVIAFSIMFLFELFHRLHNKWNDRKKANWKTIPEWQLIYSNNNNPKVIKYGTFEKCDWRAITCGYIIDLNDSTKTMVIYRTKDYYGKPCKVGSWLKMIPYDDTTQDQ